MDITQLNWIEFLLDLIRVKLNGLDISARQRFIWPIIQLSIFNICFITIHGYYKPYKINLTIQPSLIN